MTRQYQNNYLLSRISGVAFDLMTIAGIASINIEDLSGLWVPFLLMAVSGGIVTLVYLQWTCRRIYPGYYYEGLVSMYGMLTGTISSGVLLLREIDDTFATPAANNLVLGSSFAILFGAPMLISSALRPIRTRCCCSCSRCARCILPRCCCSCSALAAGGRKSRAASGPEPEGACGTAAAAPHLFLNVRSHFRFPVRYLYERRTKGGAPHDRAAVSAVL